MRMQPSRLDLLFNPLVFESLARTAQLRVCFRWWLAGRSVLTPEARATCSLLLRSNVVSHHRTNVFRAQLYATRRADKRVAHLAVSAGATRRGAYVIGAARGHQSICAT